MEIETVHQTFRHDPNQLARIRLIARNHRTTVSQLCRRGLDLAVAELELVRRTVDDADKRQN